MQRAFRDRDQVTSLFLYTNNNKQILLQFTAWVDAVIFVFSLENDVSYNTVSTYFNKMSHYRNSAEIPIILVGTQGKYYKR